MNQRNITQLIERSMNSGASHEWSPSKTAEVLECLRDASGAEQIDWDRDAGETWGRLLVETQPIVALSAVVPIAIVRTPVDSRLFVILDRMGIATIASSDWDQHEFTADPEIVKRAFRRESWSAAVDPNTFSASELWWMTV